ncbi:MAG TPA: PelD GGDEF domain-containing protein [Rhodocyclaceae bacterium]|nr:PelD GGDEF domain-containing protein [Rhodocyclaceae bacterium]
MKFKLTRFIAPVGKPAMALIETLLLPAFMVALGLWLNPVDPMFTRSSFPWAWLGPLVLALRYGPIEGLGGGLVLFLAWFGLEGITHANRHVPDVYFLGGLIMVMLAGEFSSIWRARVRRAEATQDYLERRLDNLTRTHYLLHLSHERLEQDLLSRPISLRDALTSLRELVADIDPHSKALPAAERLLKLSAQLCQVERAALVPFTDDTPEDAAAVFLGAPFALHWNDPLPSRAVSDYLLTHIASADVEQRSDSRYLVAAPVVEPSGRLRAILLIEAMPFFALQEETLQTLNLMLGYYADSLAAAPLVTQIRQPWPSCPSPFALELQRLTRLERESSVPSALIALQFVAGKSAADLPDLILRQRRLLDVVWMIGDDEHQPRALLVILPLAREAAVAGYLARLAVWLENQYEKDMEGVGMRNRVWHIGDEEPLTLLGNILESCHVAEQARAVRPAA